LSKLFSNYRTCYFSLFFIFFILSCNRFATDEPTFEKKGGGEGGKTKNTFAIACPLPATSSSCESSKYQ
jgi:hypothetical protein